MNLKYNGVTLYEKTLNMLIKEAERLNVPASYLIVKLHYEGVWGQSAVAKANNNLSGMTWTGNPNRPSGVVATRGGARPAKEGGYYFKYATLDDFFKDWLHLIRDGGNYTVANSSSFDEAVKGMFRCGGAKYDYATMDYRPNDTSLEASKARYEKYLAGMKARREQINRANNGSLDQLDKVERKGETNMPTVNQLIIELKKHLGAVKGTDSHKRIIDGYNAVKPLPMGYAVKYTDDWCDTFVTYVADRIGLKIGRECGVERHKQIFKKLGIWKGLVRPQVGDIVIFNWQGNRNGWGKHIGYVYAVNGDMITTVEGNTTKNGVSCVAMNQFPWNSKYIQGYARPAYTKHDVKPTPQPQVDVTQLARDVIAGKFGEGEERKRLLGSNYDKVQAKVNELLKGTPRKEVEEKQQEAIVKVEDSKITDQDKNLLIQELMNLVTKEEIEKVIEKVLK